MTDRGTIFSGDVRRAMLFGHALDVLAATPPVSKHGRRKRLRANQAKGGLSPQDFAFVLADFRSES